MYCVESVTLLYFVFVEYTAIVHHLLLFLKKDVCALKRVFMKRTTPSTTSHTITSINTQKKGCYAHALLFDDGIKSTYYGHSFLHTQ